MKTIKPILPLPIKPTEDLDTAMLPATTIPPALCNLFFSGQMPLPPSTNMAYKIGYIGKHPRIIPSVALEIFKADAALILANARYSFVDWNQLALIRSARQKTPLAVIIRAYFATEWRRDLDGVVKFAIDAAFTYLRLNDNQVVRLEAEKLLDASAPRVEIEIRTFTR